MLGRSWRWDGWARKQGGRKISTTWRERESDGSGSDNDGRKTKGEWGQPHFEPPYLWGAPPNLSVAVPSTVQHASMALFREIRENIKADFSLTDYSYDLNLSLGRQPNKKITSGRPNGKHVLQAPTSH
jgi:hypothetical protein